MDLYAGTSGFAFTEWRGSFYVEKQRVADMLRAYAERLPTVEINNTFHRTPRTSVVTNWRAQVPDSFRFALKAPLRITHAKRLRGVEEEVGWMLKQFAHLGASLGAVLFQTHADFAADAARLEAFLALLPEGYPAAFEFRHASWLDDPAVLKLLRARNCAACGGDDEDGTSTLRATADWGYLRFRLEDYTDVELAARWRVVREQPWRRAFVYFKHEDEGNAPGLALRFLAMAGANASPAAPAAARRKIAPSRRVLPAAERKHAASARATKRNAGGRKRTG